MPCPVGGDCGDCGCLSRRESCPCASPLLPDLPSLCISACREDMVPSGDARCVMALRSIVRQKCICQNAAMHLPDIGLSNMILPRTLLTCPRLGSFPDSLQRRCLAPSPALLLALANGLSHTPAGQHTSSGDMHQALACNCEQHSQTPCFERGMYTSERCCVLERL